jgi:hypothetical protein
MPAVRRGRRSAGQELVVEGLAFDVVGGQAGSAGTEFGVPSRRPSTMRGRWTRRRASGGDRREGVEPLRTDGGHRARGSGRVPGGGRNTSKVVAHVLDADQAARRIGIKRPGSTRPTRRGPRHARGMLDVLRPPATARPSRPPLAARYAAHRIAWHALDHLWEIEDRSTPEPPG